MRKQRILIVDDSEMNRALLSEMLGEDYEILEAADGVQAILTLQHQHTTIDLVLLDVVMPHAGGFEVLEVMSRNKWIEETPVIMISAESGPDQAERAYELGVTDFIIRPFDASIVRHRVDNTLFMYAKQKQLLAKVEEQVYEKEKNNSVMVDILSHIVEFRNGESGMHVLHVRAITNFLLHRLGQMTGKYDLPEEIISQISTASALHDIGKIGIDEKILNKPGRLTPEEFDLMKTHSMIGAHMLEGLVPHQDNPLVKTAYEICRWHHERYNGTGYPDGLKGDEIPISAQVVALADVYDALTSERVYKAPLPHEEAVQMILRGECGVFNPILMECLRKNANGLRAQLQKDVAETLSRREIRNLANEALNDKNYVPSERTMRLLDMERMKNDFFSDSAEEIRFEYAMSSHILTLSSWSARRLGVNEVILEPANDVRVQEVIGGINWRELLRRLQQTTPEEPEISFESKLLCDGEPRWHRMVVRGVWTPDEPRRCEGALGKAVDIHDAYLESQAALDQASRDRLTKLLTLEAARQRITDCLTIDPLTEYMVVLLDLRDFKTVNTEYGRKFSNEVLRHTATVLDNSLRVGDISARIAGGTFLIFMESCTDDARDRVLGRIYNALVEPYGPYTAVVSMGIARTADVGANFDVLLAAADRAMYLAKRNDAPYEFYTKALQGPLPGYKPTIHSRKQ